MAKKYIFISLSLAVIAFLAWAFFKFQQPEIESFEGCLKAGYPILETYPRQCKIIEGKLFTEDIGNELAKQDLIFVTSVRPHQEISSKLLVEGAARGFWFFEASFPVRIYDSNNNELGMAVAQAQDDWMTEKFVPFQVAIQFLAAATQRGTLVLEKDNPSGLPENADELRIPVVFRKSGVSETTTNLKVFFNNGKLDPEFSCDKVFAVSREVPKTQAVARAALEELLKGPAERDKALGFITSINSGVKIQKLTIEDDTAKVDFNSQLEFQTGGSCRVAAIRMQITETLKQFPSVKDVIISIDGRTEDILQP